MRALVVTAILCFAVAIAAADKQAVNSTFAGKIVLSDKRFPSQAKSLADFNAKVTKQSVAVFKEDPKDRSYMIYFAGFLKAPLDDVEYVVKLYELLPKGQQLLASFEQYSDERGQTSLLSKMKLEHKTVGVNKDVIMTIENKGKVLASTKFRILGQAEKSSGKVNFSEDEANGNKKLDDDD